MSLRVEWLASMLNCAYSKKPFRLETFLRCFSSWFAITCVFDISVFHALEAKEVNMFICSNISIINN